MQNEKWTHIEVSQSVDNIWIERITKNINAWGWNYESAGETNGETNGDHRQMEVTDTVQTISVFKKTIKSIQPQWKCIVNGIDGHGWFYVIKGTITNEKYNISPEQKFKSSTNYVANLHNSVVYLVERVNDDLFRISFSL